MQNRKLNTVLIHSCYCNDQVDLDIRGGISRAIKQMYIISLVGQEDDEHRYILLKLAR